MLWCTAADFYHVEFTGLALPMCKFNAQDLVRCWHLLPPRLEGPPCTGNPSSWGTVALSVLRLCCSYADTANGWQGRLCGLLDHNKHCS